MRPSPLHTRIATGVLLGVVVCLWPAAWRWAAPALSPYLAIGSAIALRSLPAALLLALPMLALAVFRRRTWCRRLCPLGLIPEYCGKMRRRGGQPAVPRLGPWLVLATLAGAAVGYPLFLWLDPLALYSGMLNRSPLALAGIPLLMLIGFLFPGAWCARICPLGAAQDLLAARPRRPGVPLRRGFLALASGAVVAAVVPRRRHLRPPGSVADPAFSGSCIRCGSCVRVCPTGIIRPAQAWGDIAGLLAPTLHFSGPNYCLQDCSRCGKVCPSGVIRPLPLAEKNRQVIGIATIDLSACLLTAETECGVCIPRCPRGAVVDTFSPATYTAAVKVLRDRCNGCGACVGICPPKAVHIQV